MIAMNNPYREFNNAIELYDRNHQNTWIKRIRLGIANWLPNSFQFVRRWKGGHWECWMGKYYPDRKKVWYQTVECNHTKNLSLLLEEQKKEYSLRTMDVEKLNINRPAGIAEVHVCCEDWF